MRAFCYTIGWALILGGIVCALTVVLIPVAVYLLIFGVGLVILTALENWKYHRHQPPGESFVPTDEKYFDEDTGKTMRVYYDPSSGERVYRPEN